MVARIIAVMSTWLSSDMGAVGMLREWIFWSQTTIWLPILVSLIDDKTPVCFS